MKKILKPETTKPQYVVTTDITYAQVDSWFGHCRRDLKLDLIYPEYDTGDTRQPYVICRQMPKIEGVVVVAQGGGNAKTVTEISNAVMSLFPVEAHKVVVVKMSVQEE